jgi:hypothetical protein
MLVVKPNPRRMQYMRDSPSETIVGVRGRRIVDRLRWGRVFLAAAGVAIVVAGVVALAPHL